MATEAGTAGVLKDTKERNVICMKKKEWILLSLPVISILVTGAVDVLVKRSLQQMKMPQPYLLYFLGLCLVVYLALEQPLFSRCRRESRWCIWLPFMPCWPSFWTG